MPLRELFHLMHMVRDFDAADAFFQRVLEPDTFMKKSWSDFDKRWASLNRVGPDFVFELMEASAKAEDQDSPLPKFARRFGQHLHSFSWYVDADDMVPIFRRLRSAGIRVGGPSGLLPDDVANEDLPIVLFTHPKDTFGQIELMARNPERSNDPVFDPSRDWSVQRKANRVGIERVAYLTNAVDDLERAKTVFCDHLGGWLFHEATDESSSRAFVLVGTDTVIELALPTRPGTRLAEDLETNGPLPHRATFQVNDLDTAIVRLEEAGASVAERSDDTVVLDPASTFGALLAFTTGRLPDDPRT